MHKLLKPSLVALGLCTALAAGSATAALTWNPYPETTLFEDDDIDALYDADLNPKPAGTIAEGDVLIAILELYLSADSNEILPDELTGVSAIQVASITPTGNGLATIVFEPYEGGLNEVLALGTDDVTVTGGEAGGDAMIAFFLDSTPNLDIAAGSLPELSCNSMTECIDQAVDGEVWQVDGISDDADDNWVATNAPLNTAPILGVEPALRVGQINAGLSILYNGTGVELEENSIGCFPFCGVGGDGLVDMVGSGSINGGLGLSAQLQADGFVATSDFDISKRQAQRVPEPSTLALLATGFLGLCVANRRRRKA